jgi:hypothetical protein
MVKKRARAARAMGTRVVGDKEGGGDGRNIARYNNGLVPVVVQQAILYLASASLDNAGNDESTGQRLAYMLRTDDSGDNETTMMMTTTLSCCPLMLQRPLVLLSLARTVIHRPPLHTLIPSSFCSF